MLAITESLYDYFWPALQPLAILSSPPLTPAPAKWCLCTFPFLLPAPLPYLDGQDALLTGIPSRLPPKCSPFSHPLIVFFFSPLLLISLDSSGLSSNIVISSYAYCCNFSCHTYHTEIPLLERHTDINSFDALITIEENGTGKTQDANLCMSRI